MCIVVENDVAVAVAIVLRPGVEVDLDEEVFGLVRHFTFYILAA